MMVRHLYLNLSYMVLSLALETIAHRTSVLSPGNTLTEPSGDKISTFTPSLNTLIFQPPTSWAAPQVYYHRVAELNNGVLLSTWEDYAPEPPQLVAPIWRSTDGGKTYHNFSYVADQVNGWGMRYQPFLYVLPSKFAGLKAGDLLFAGNSIPANLNQTKIDVYSSTDGGKTWTFLSSVVSGGAAVPSNGYKPVWEPFLTLWEGKLICYYSDQRDPKHGQKLAHKVTKDLKTWSKGVNDVTYPAYEERPGMFITVQLPNTKWIATFESCGDKYGCQVHYKIADNPLKFGSAKASPLVATDGTSVYGSPYVTWVRNGGANGTIIANGDTDSYIYVNTDLAVPGSPWTRINVETNAAYSRTLRPLSDGTSLFIGGAGQSAANNVTYSIISLAAFGI